MKPEEECSESRRTIGLSSLRSPGATDEEARQVSGSPEWASAGTALLQAPGFGMVSGF